MLHFYHRYVFYLEQMFYIDYSIKNDWKEDEMAILLAFINTVLAHEFYVNFTHF